MKMNLGKEVVSELPFVLFQNEAELHLQDNFHLHQTHFNKGTGQYNYTRTGPTFGVGGGVLKDTTYLRTLPTTFYWLLNLS